MHRKPEDDHGEAARLDRERTGEAVNARTDELQKELDREAGQLQNKYVKTEKPEADVKKD